MDSFTEVTDESWFGRIKNAIFGVLIGGVLFVAAFPVLFLNEGCVRRNYLGIVQTQKDCVQLAEAKVDPVNEGKPIHLTAKLIPVGKVADPKFQLQGTAIKLTRDVEMYQWEEKKKTRSKKKLGGGKRKETTYTYRQTWLSNLVDSSRFHHREGHKNPTSMPVKSKTFHPKAVTAGDFTVPASLINQITQSTTLPAKQKYLAGLPDTVRPKARVSGNVIYIGTSPDSPQTGDTRISFKIVKPQQASIISGQKGKALAPFQPEQGNSINLLKAGTHSSEEMFKDLHSQNQMRAWIIRGAGFLMMLIGLCLVFKPLEVVADVIPFIGSLVGVGIGLFAGLVSIALSLITISIAWVVYRPLLGIPLLITGVIAIVFVLVKGASRKASAYQS